MILEGKQSECALHEKVIVSSEAGKTHRAINADGRFKVRQFKIDKMVQNQKCCDYLVLNDSSRVAYFIELKGTDISGAIDQLENGFRIFKEELKGFTSLFRIVAKRIKTQELDTPEVRKLKKDYKGRLRYKSVIMDDILY